MSTSRTTTRYLFTFFISIIFILCDSSKLFPQQKLNKEQLKLLPKKLDSSEEYIGGLIDKSQLKIGFFNNGRFSAPYMSHPPALPSAQYGQNGYLGILDLWVGIPEGPWTPEIWNADSQKYVSLGPTVSGTYFNPFEYNYGTDWSTINATKGALYTDELLYSDVYKSTGNIDFILSPTSEYEKTWPRDPLIGFREWPGRWQKDPLTGKPIIGAFLATRIFSSHSMTKCWQTTIIL